MNLQAFLDYRIVCPMCVEDSLKLEFHSTRKQKHRIEDGRYLILFDMKGIKKQKDYKIGFSFDKNNSEFYIEFYTKDDNKLNQSVPIDLINRFKEFYINLANFRFYRTCESCRKYTCASEIIDLDFNTKMINDILVEYEYFGLSMKSGKQHKIFRLLNFNADNTSLLTCFKSESEDATLTGYKIPHDAEVIKLPMIKFVSMKETTNRVHRLLTFS